MSDDRRAQLKRLLESGGRNLQPLTFPQRELWEASPVPPGDVSNHICAFIEVKGVITEKDCEAALLRVVERQEVFRLSFLPGKESTLQLIRPTGIANIRFQNLRPEQCNPESVNEIMEAIFHEPFDLLKGPLYRVVMLRKAPDDLILVFAIHHAIADGWSLGVFVQDLAAAYMQGLRGGQRLLPPVPLSCSAWAAAERAYWLGAEINSRADYWKSKLANLPRLWKPAIPVVSKPLTHLLNRWVSSIPADLAQQVRDLSRKSSTTLFSTLLSGFQVAFSKWSKATDIVVGTPVANRNKQNVRETMGYFAGNVPLRRQIDADKTYHEALMEVHRDTLDAFAHAMPFAELAPLVGETPASGKTPIYEVRFALQNHPVPDIAVPGLSLKLRMRSTGTARFALGCEVTEETGSLEVVWLFKESVLNAGDVEDLDVIFKAVLAELCQKPDSSISSSTI